MNRKSERGAILILTAVCIFVLTAMAAFVIDRGIAWFAREQAQNAADAGALAGATAIAYDSSLDVSNTGPAYINAQALAYENGLAFSPTVGVHVDVDPATTWEHPKPPICGAGIGCVQVDVYADGTHGSSQLPAFFANVFGVSSLAMRATATGMAAAANTQNCLRPWMIPDKWQENGGSPTTFDPGIDVYRKPPVAPATTPVGTGYTVANDVGTVVTLDPGDPHGAIGPSDYYQVVIDQSCVGGNCYRDAISMCTHTAVRLHDPATTDCPGLDANGTASCLESDPGGSVGPTKQGVADLVALDPTAVWNGTSVVNANGIDGGSPRIVPIAMFDPSFYFGLDHGTGRFWLPVVNMMGFFVQSIDNSTGNITGVLVRDSGSLSPGTVTPGPGAAFLMIPVLVR